MAREAAAVREGHQGHWPTQTKESHGKSQKAEGGCQRGPGQFYSGLALQGLRGHAEEAREGTTEEQAVGTAQSSDLCSETVGGISSKATQGLNFLPVCLA